MSVSYVCECVCVCVGGLSVCVWDGVNEVWFTSLCLLLSRGLFVLVQMKAMLDPNGILNPRKVLA